MSFCLFQRLAVFLGRSLSCLMIVQLLSAHAATAQEIILSYDSEISIESDASMLVVETIRVRAEGREIQRGIYRTFPTTYRDHRGHRVRVGFEFIGAERDGKSETARVTSEANGVKIRLGEESVFLSPGEYRYTIRYRTTRQLGFFEEHDELFWNVTGNGWDFAIEQATATIRLPERVPAPRLQAEGFTGPKGSTERQLNTEVFDGGASYRSTVLLAPSEGLSIVLRFPKGVVPEPTDKERALALLSDNRQLLIAMAGFLLLLLWYGWRWHRYGRDPAAGVRIPQYEPPKGYSPASLRFVRKMGYDNKTFAAAVLSLASKGAIEIEQDSAGTYTLIRKEGADQSRFAAGERALFSQLFSASESRIELKRSASTAERMRATQDAHVKSLTADYEKKYFVTNIDTVVIGVILSVVTLVSALLAVPGEMKIVALFICFWLSIWTFGVYGIFNQAIQLLRMPDIRARVGGGMMLFFGLPFLAGEVFGLTMLAITAGVGMVIAFALLLGTNLLFYHLMKAPTIKGARLLDRIEGFRWYLGVAEKDELDSRYRPESMPDRFAELLPYALALDVDQAWAQRFADALPAHRLAEAQPSWYRSSAIGGATFTATGLTAVAAGLSSGLSSAISSASSPPGSSSGGGSSGGGGGGGGGGGW